MVNTTFPTAVAASLVLVVQSPWAGLFVPNATVLPVAGTYVVELVSAPEPENFAVPLTIE